MHNRIDTEEYKKEHKGNLFTLLKIYWSNKPIWKSYFFWFAFLSSVAIQIIISVFNSSYYCAIEFVANQMISIMPNILGFNLGGYVLLIGLNSQNILDEITEPTESSRFSLFQMQSGVFAFSILIQASSIIIGYMMIEIMHLGGNIIIPDSIGIIVNFIAFFVLNFISLYALVLIGQIVLNIFNFGQILHFFIRLDRLENDVKKKKSN